METRPVLQRVPHLAGGDGAAATAVEQGVQRKRLRFTVDIPFTKQATLDASGNLELVGYASTWVLDRDGEYIDPRAFDDSLPDYLAQNPILLWQHNMDWPLGQIVEAKIDANGLLVRAVVRKPQDGEEPWKLSAYNDIAAGIVRTFSIGGFFTRDFAGGRVMVTEVELLEISVVSIPSNPTSLFEAAQKALSTGTGGRPDLPQKAIDQMQQLLGLRDMADPELVVLQRRGTDALDERYALLCSLYRKAGKLPPGRQVWEEAKAVADPRARLVRVMDVMQLAQGQVSAKRGRVLSKATETKLRQAVGLQQEASQLLAGVLAQVEEQPDVPDQEGVHDYRGDNGEPCTICGQPPDHADHTGGKAASLVAGPQALQEALALAAAGQGYQLGADGWYYAATYNEKGALPLATLPFAPRTRAWDGAAAKRRVHGMAHKDDGTYQPSVLSKAYLWIDNGADNTKVTSYRFIVADVVGGQLQYIPRGIFAAAVVLQGGRSGTVVDTAGVAALKAKIGQLYGRMANEFNDPALVAPWDKGS